MSRCDFNKVVSNFIEIAYRHECSPVNLLHIFRTPFPKNNSGWLLLKLCNCAIHGDTIEFLFLIRKTSQRITVVYSQIYFT